MHAFPILALIASAASSSGAANGAAPPASAPFAVVELFTSEGCSSCPSADRLLSDLGREAEKGGRNVIALEFHVDYWDSPAWKDPWSDAAFSERQRGYAHSLESGLYTPQAVVNGRAECVGSDAARLRAEIDQALARAPHAVLEVEPVLEGGHPAIHYRAAGIPSGARVCAALTESGLSSHVKGGENAGRDLVHDGVVREFHAQTISEHESGTLRFAAASGPPRRIVVFVQDPKTLEILAATSVRL